MIRLQRTSHSTKEKNKYGTSTRSPPNARQLHNHRRGHCLKNGDGDTLTPFFKSFSSIDTLFLTRYHPMTPLFLNNSPPILNDFSPNDILFWQHFVKCSIYFDFFFKNVPKFVICGERLSKTCLILTVWISHSMTPFSEEFPHRKEASFELLFEQHCHFQSLPPENTAVPIECSA